MAETYFFNIDEIPNTLLISKLKPFINLTQHTLSLDFWICFEFQKNLKWMLDHHAKVTQVVKNTSRGGVHIIKHRLKYTRLNPTCTFTSLTFLITALLRTYCMLYVMALKNKIK